MKKVSCLAIVGMFILSIALIGCGNLKKQEFDSIFTEYQSEQETIHGELNAKMTGIDQKLDQEISDRKTSVDEAMNEAKNDAMAAAEQGDADTLDAAKSEDDKVRQDAKRMAQEAEENAKKFAQSEAEKVRGQAEQAAREAMNAANSAAGTANRAVTDIAALRGEMQKIKPPITVAVVNFASGRAVLTAEAKATLDAAVNDIRMHGNAPVMVKGHADGTPVLRGRYQSNWDLSQDRANAVVKYLQEKGVDNPIEAVARAHTEPVAPAFTRDGRAKNRRAEVIVYPSGTVE